MIRSGRYTIFGSAALALVLLAAAAVADNGGVAGDWEGEMSAGGQSIGVIFHVTEKDDGSLSGTMDVPAQGAMGIPADETTFADGTLTLIFNSVPGGGRYEGTLSEDEHSLEGTWSQGPNSLPLNLTKIEEEES